MRSFTVRQLIPIVLALLTEAVPAAAQAPELQLPARLTLVDARRIARENHPGFAVQRARMEAADAEEQGTATWLRYLPTLSLSLGAQVMQSRVLTGTDEFGRSVRLDDPISYRRTDSDFGPSIGRITLFDGGAGLRNARATRAGVRSTRAAVAVEELQLETQLIRAYYEALRAFRNPTPPSNSVILPIEGPKSESVRR
jgi:outer membrane protein TolC